MGNGNSSSSLGQGSQVGRVVENSPAHQAGLLPFFDFVVSVDNQELQGSGPFFRQYASSHLGQPITLDVFNSKTRSMRQVQLTPSNTWGGAGVVGCALLWEEIEEAMSRVWRILEVRPGSHAQRVGLQAMRHFIIGMQNVPPPGQDAQRYVSLFRDDQDFHRRLDGREQAYSMPAHPLYKDSSLLLLVYDAVTNEIQEVMTNFPLGCDVGTGYLHTIPSTGVQDPPIFKGYYHAPEGSQQPQAQPQPQQAAQGAAQYTVPAAQPASAAPQVGLAAPPAPVAPAAVPASPVDPSAAAAPAPQYGQVPPAPMAPMAPPAPVAPTVPQAVAPVAVAPQVPVAQPKPSFPAPMRPGGVLPGQTSPSSAGGAAVPPVPFPTLPVPRAPTVPQVPMK